MNETILIIILIFVIVIFIFMHLKEVKYIESHKGKKFLVRNMKDSKKAAETLQEMIDRINYMTDYTIQHTTPNDFIYPYIKTIKNKLPYILFRESTSKNKFTSYSINKGEEIVMCLRSKKTHQLHNLNEILYVAIHEIAHVGCPELDHTPLFNKINKTLLEYAVKANVYEYKNYDMSPEEYCGIEINTTMLNL